MWVFTVYYSICIFWTCHCIVKPKCSIFRMIIGIIKVVLFYFCFFFFSIFTLTFFPFVNSSESIVLWKTKLKLDCAVLTACIFFF